MRHPYYPHRPTWIPASGPAHEMITERQPGDPLETIVYEYAERPAVWIYTGEHEKAPSWHRAIVGAKQRHRAGWAVQVAITLGGSGYARIYWWGRDNVVPASPPRT